MEVALQQQQQQSGGGVAAPECRRPGPTRPVMIAATKPEREEGAEDHQEEQDALLRRGPWTVDEDLTLINYIAEHGEGRWNALARAAGLKRTGKSCRLRWLNYLRPDVKRGDFTADEQLLILDLHSRWGNRWSKIASQLPGRTDNEIKNYWRTRVQKHARQLNCDVNSRRFKDAMRFLWMPRLAERAAADSSHSHSAGAAPTPPPSCYDGDHHRSSPAPSSGAGATATSSSSTATSSLTSSDHHHPAGAGAVAALDDDTWAVAAAQDQEFWSTASALQQLTAAADNQTSSSSVRCGCFHDQADDQDLISGWVQGFSEITGGAIVSASSSSHNSSLWSLDDIWRTMH